MKKLLGIILLFFALIFSTFAFEIYNSDGVVASYFSMSNSQVFVKTSQNLSSFQVFYNISGNNFSNVVDLAKCDSLYCGDFSLINLITNNNGSFSGSSEFLIKVGSEMKKVYLDFEKPTFNLSSFEILSDVRKLNLKFDFSDNSNKISSVKLYQKDDSNLIFVKDVLNLSSYNFSLKEEGNLTLRFVVEDEAKNIYTFDSDFQIGDFFNPVITKTFVIFKDESFYLNFDISDDNLDKYEIIQSGISLSEDVSGTGLSKEIKVPFSSGKIIFRVLDIVGNQVNKTINLDTKITNNYLNKYSNQKNFKFTSDATNCFLEKLSDKSINKDFSKSSNTFSIDLDISQVKLYTLDFYCEKDGFRQYFNSDFYYDIEEPSESELSVSETNEGYLKLSWTESKDSQSPVKYYLYKDDSKIYTGTKLEYTDLKVIYPESYGYYLKVEDEAGNSVQSNQVKAVPKKVKVSFSSNINVNDVVEVDKSNYLFTLNTDEKSKVSVVVKNNDKVIFEKIIENTTSSKLDYNLELTEGINQILINIEDEFGNIESQTYFVTYLKPIEVVKVDTSSVKVVDSIENNQNNSVINETINESSLVVEDDSNIIFWLFLIIIVLILILYFGYNFVSFDAIKINKSKKNFKKNSSSKSKKMGIRKNIFKFEKKDDFGLEKSLYKVRKQRVERQKKLALEKKRLENKKELSEFSKNKINDISRKSSFNFTKDSLNKNNIILKREKTDLEEIPQTHQNLSKSNFSLFNKKKKEEPKKDDLSLYITKIRESKSWGSTKEYLMKTKLEKEKLEQDKLRAKQEAQNQKLAEQRAKQEEVQRKEEDKARKEQEKQRFKEERKIAKDSLNDYLGKRTKKKKSFFFAERAVERDLRNRRN